MITPANASKVPINVSFELTPLTGDPPPPQISPTSKFEREDLKPLDEKTEWVLLNGPKQVTRRRLSPRKDDPLQIRNIEAE